MGYIFILKLLATVIFGTVLGFLTSIPVGAVQLEVIKKTINGHKKPAIATAMGSAVSDLLYGMLALFGFGDYMLHKEKRIKYGKRLSFITGFTIAITNPGMIIWWFVGFKIFADFNLFPVMTPAIKALFVISGAFGLALYLTLVAVILHRYKKSFSEKFLYKANTFLMFILAFLISYFAIKLLCIIFNFNLLLNF